MLRSYENRDESQAGIFQKGFADRQAVGEACIQLGCLGRRRLDVPLVEGRSLLRGIRAKDGDVQAIQPEAPFGALHGTE